LWVVVRYIRAIRYFRVLRGEYEDLCIVLPSVSTLISAESPGSFFFAAELPEQAVNRREAPRVVLNALEPPGDALNRPEKP
jgi:hypothetical protein